MTSDVSEIILKRGAHDTREEGMCFMEAVACAANEPHSDHPQCACPVLGAFARRLNDACWPDDAARTEALRPAIMALIGTRSTPEVERARGNFFVDRLVRELRPERLDQWANYRERVLRWKAEHTRYLRDMAARLRAFAPIVDEATRLAVIPQLRAIADEARARRDNLRADLAAEAAYADAEAAYADADADAADAAYAAAAADAYAAAAADAAYAAADARLRILRRAAEILVEATKIKAPTGAEG